MHHSLMRGSRYAAYMTRLGLLLFVFCLTPQAARAQGEVTTVIGDGVFSIAVPAIPISPAYADQPARFAAERAAFDQLVKVSTQCKTDMPSLQGALQQAIEAKALSVAEKILNQGYEYLNRVQRFKSALFKVEIRNDSPAGNALKATEANIAAAKQTLTQMQKTYLDGYAATKTDTKQGLAKAVAQAASGAGESGQFPVLDQNAKNFSDFVAKQFFPPIALGGEIVDFESLPMDIETRTNDIFLDKIRSAQAKTTTALAFRYQADLLRMSENDIPPENHSLWDSSVEALKTAYQTMRDKVGSASYKFYRVSETLLKYAMSPTGLADFGSAMTPVVSEARAFYELINGKDVISGAPLGLGSRALLGVGILLGVGEGPEEVALSIERAMVKDAIATAVTKDAFAGSEHCIEAAKSVAIAEKEVAGTQAALEEAEKNSPNLMNTIVSQEPEALGRYGEGLVRIPHEKRQEFEKMLDDYLGKDYKNMKSENFVLISADDQRKIRFDFINPHGFDPHVHFEIYDNGWVDAFEGLHHIYPKKTTQ